MKKVLMMIAAMITAITVSAQVNVARDKHVYPIGGYVGNVTEAGLQTFTDGNEEGFNEAEASLQDGDVFQAFYIDLEKEEELGAIAVKWEGACAKDYKIYATNEAPESLASLANIEPVATVEGLEGGAGAVQTKGSPVDTKARYISFVIESAATGWNVKIIEIYAYTKFESRVKKFSLSRYLYNETMLQQADGVITMNVMAVDDMDMPYGSALTYTIAPDGAIAVEDGVATITGVSAGTYTVTATDESGNAVSRNFSIVAEPAAAPSAPESAVIGVFSDSYNNGAQPGISDKGWNWRYDTYEWWNIKDNFSYYVHNVGTFGLDGTAKNISEYPALHFDIFASEDIDAAHVTVEGAGEMPFSVKGGQWNHIVLDYSEKANLTNCSWVQFYIGADMNDNDHDMLIDNVYFMGTRYEDAVAPVLVKSEVTATTATSVKFTLQATDEPAEQSRTIVYTISNGTDTKSVRGANGEEIEFVFSNLQSDTEYTFTIVAEDTNGNSSETTAVTAKTQPLVAAPVPTHNKHLVRSLYSDVYETIVPALTFDSWGSRTQLNHIAIDGNNTLQFNDMDYYGIMLNSQYVVTDDKMEYLHIDIYAETDGSVGVTPIWWNLETGANYPEIDKIVTLKGGEWNQIDIALADYADETRVEDRMHQLKLHLGGGNNLLVDNIYLWRNEGTLASKEVTESGVNVLEGEWDEDMFAMIDESMASSAYDLVGVTNLPEDKALELKAQNAYALFITAKAGTVAANELVKDGEGYKATVLKFVENGEGIYNLNTSLAPISADDVTVERHLASGNVYTTVTLPFDVAVLPAGVKAYTLNAANTVDGETTLLFEEVESIEADKPYIVYAPADVLSFSGAADMTFKAEKQEKNGVTFVANYAEKNVAAEDNTYTMSEIPAADNLEFNLADGITIRPFSAYIMADGAKQTINVSFDLGNGIHAADAETISKLFDVYTIDGQKVMHNASGVVGLKSGVYIINGKKVIIK